MFFGTNHPFMGTNASSVGTEITSAGTEMTSAGKEMTSAGKEMTSAGKEMTSVSTEMTSASTEMTSAGTERAPVGTGAVAGCLITSDQGRKRRRTGLALAISLTAAGTCSGQPSSSDLWDISNGVSVGAHSTFDQDPCCNQNFDARDLFGGCFTGFLPERCGVVFADQAPFSTVDFVEWATVGVVAINRVDVFHTADSASVCDRGISFVRIYGRRAESDPWSEIAANNSPPRIGNPTTLTCVQQPLRFFRAEFGRLTCSPQLADGPRIIEIDAIGLACARLVAMPLSVATCPEGSPVFSVAAAGSGPFTYQWQVSDTTASGGWAILNDGPLAIDGSPTCASVSGAHDPALVLALACSAGAGDLPGRQFRCIVTNACGSATSNPATLTICPADFNCDGNTDPDDLGDMINCYFDTPPCSQADFNNDGNIDPDDLGDYINIFFGPPC